MLIQILLALYIILFLLSILSLVIRVKKTTGVFPIIQNKPGVYGFVDRLVTIAYVLVIANAITFITNYAPISVFNPLITLETMLLQYIGTALIGIALSLMYLAQLQMKESWRIGVDTQNEIELINKGLFRYFRHPIYFFALLIGVGMVLVIPTAISIFIFIILYIALSIQSRVEEEFMTQKFGDQYKTFLKTHKRFF